MPTISASAARQTLPAQLDRVEQGEEIVITRHGRAVAVLVRPDALTARRAPEARTRADQIDALLLKARAEPLRRPALDHDRADELVEMVYAGRAGR